MAKLPIYQQQTTQGQVRADPTAFGAGVAQAQGQLADTAMEYGMQLKRRADVIERVQFMSDFDRFAQEALTTINDTEDISRPETVLKYEQLVKQKADEIVKAHRGTGASRAELTAQITNQAAQYTKSALATQVKAQQAQIGNLVEQSANELAISAAFAPDKMTDIFTEMDRRIDGLGDAIAQPLSTEYKNAARAKIATNAITTTLQRGDWQTARKMMENPEVAKYLNPDVSRKFVIDIAVDEGRQAAEIQRQNAAVQSWTTRLGRNLTAEEQMKVRSLPPEKDMGPAERIVQYELITGKPVTQAIADQFFKVEGSGFGSGAAGMFGNSLQGRALAYVTDNAVAYANGMLMPDQARIFEASMAEAYKPVMRPNPVTGQVEEIRPTVPAFVQQAAGQGSRFYQGGALPPRQPAPAPAGGMGGALPPRQPAPAPAGGMAPAAAPAGAASQPIGGAAGGNQPSPADEPTIWEMAEAFAGPASAIAAGAAGLPVVGGRVGPAVEKMLGTPQNVTGARQYIRTQVSQMVDALSINPRNPVALVEMIRKELDVDPKVMDNATAYRKRIEAVNRALTERLIEESRAGQDPSLPAKTRQDALTVADTIRNFQRKLMPPKVKNLRELDSMGLKPGNKFIDPEGKLRTYK